MAVAVHARREAGRIASDAMRSVMNRRMAELGAIALALAGLAALVALACYDPRDPSLNTATAGVTHNLAGRPGALVADVLLQGFGLAGMLPGVTLLAWAWRLGSHRGLANLPLRVAALLAALPVTAAVLASVPGPHGAAIPWPTAAGPGGAAGMVLKADALAAGAEMIGPVGPVLVWILAAALATLLVVLALGLTAREWQAAGEAMERAATGGQEAAGVLAVSPGWPDAPGWRCCAASTAPARHAKPRRNRPSSRPLSRRARCSRTPAASRASPCRPRRPPLRLPRRRQPRAAPPRAPSRRSPSRDLSCPASGRRPRRSRKACRWNPAGAFRRSTC